MNTLPADPKTRKSIPLARGLLDYFPGALAEVSIVSRVANDQHNPGELMHWARGKSTDHADCIVRHLIDRGAIDDDGLRHTAKLAWRALALLQEELEAHGAPPGRASVFPDEVLERIAADADYDVREEGYPGHPNAAIEGFDYGIPDGGPHTVLVHGVRAHPLSDLDRAPNESPEDQR